MDTEPPLAIPDQRAHWNRLHAEPRGRLARDEPSWFARDCAPLISPGADLLELGCGAGQDAVWFASHGHRVVAADIAETAIAVNRDRYQHCAGVDWRTLDTAGGLPFIDRAFDVVYAHLSLHYFRDAVTRAVVVEIRRVLRPGGRLCFCCKSTADPLYGQGDLIEPDVYLHRGHLRHFFSEPYVRSLLAGSFAIERLAAVAARDVDPTDDASAFLAVVARAR